MSTLEGKMKYLKLLLTLLVLFSCSTNDSTWNGGAQRQEQTEDEAAKEQQETIRNQFPGGRNY
jgi:hypothetical protein